MPRYPDTKPDIDSLIDEVIALEADFSDHPADRGGPARWAVTETVARVHGYAGDIRHFPREEATAICRRKYWLRPGLDQIAQHAPQLFGPGINLGTSIAIGFFRRVLNALDQNGRDDDDISVDREIGCVTMAARVAFLRKRGTKGEFFLLQAIDAIRGVRYAELAETRPANAASLYVWLANRIDRIPREPIFLMTL